MHFSVNPLLSADPIRFSSDTKVFISLTKQLPSLFLFSFKSCLVFSLSYMIDDFSGPTSELDRKAALQHRHSFYSKLALCQSVCNRVVFCVNFTFRGRICVPGSEAAAFLQGSVLPLMKKACLLLLHISLLFQEFLWERAAPATLKPDERAPR